MKIKKILFVLLVLTLILSACAPKATEAPAETEAAPAETEAAPAETEAATGELPAPPPFDKACTPDDEGKVKPVDKMPDKPMKIAVLGLENNPFWIPVKQGTLDAAEELKAYILQQGY